MKNKADHPIDQRNKTRPFCLRVLQGLFKRCHEPDTNHSLQQPVWWNKYFPFPYFASYRNTIQVLCIVIIFLLVWGIMFTQLGKAASLQGELFSMTLMVIVSYLVGWVWLKVTTLPALLGVLLTGIVFRNAGWLNMTDQYKGLDQNLRYVSLVIILIRAGLDLDAHIMKKHYQAVIKLGVVPWLAECVAIGVTTHFLLGLPWIWSFLQGSMIASASPDVVVPCLLKLRDEGYGAAKGIPTMVLAGSAIDDAVSVAIFSIILSIIASTGSMIYNIIGGPSSIVAGIVLGSACGALLSIFPEKEDPYVVPLRFIILFTWCLFSEFMSSSMGWNGAGPLAIVCSGFVAAFFWKRQGWEVGNNPVCEIFRILWIFFEPVLFALTGAQITFSLLDPGVVAWGVLSLVSSLMIRMAITVLVCFGCGLNTKEKLFIGITLLPKAAVHAALGPETLDLVHRGAGLPNYPAEEAQRYATILMTVSVLSVLISAPLGAVLISITGPRFLQRQSPDNKPKDVIVIETGI